MENSKTPVLEYISNPLKLASRSAKNLFNANKRWAILLIVLGIFSTFSSSDGTNTQNQALGTSSSAEISVAFVVFIVSFALLFALAVAVVSVYVGGMLSFVALESEKGNKVTFRQAFDATSKRFWLLLGATLLAGLKILGWLLLFIVPGIIAMLRYSLLSYVIMDGPAEENTVKASHDRVKQLTVGRLWEVLGVSITGFIPFIGTLFSTAGYAGLYTQLKVYTDSKNEKPKIHWLNYWLPVVIILLSIILSLAVFAWITG